MLSRRQSRVTQGEKSNINNIDLGPLLSIRSRDKIPLLPIVTQRSTVSAPASDSFVNVAHLRPKTGASCATQRETTAENYSRAKLQALLTAKEESRGEIEKRKQVEKLRKEFVERNTLHFTKLREAFRTIDKDHNGCETFSFILHFLKAYTVSSPVVILHSQVHWTKKNFTRPCNSWAASM
jgi:hypothetical protein